jgi:3-phosphoshikimate 1-carboxyvinyltransferase
VTASGDRAPRPVPAGRTARGAVVVPPSKSVSHRYLNLALLARQPISIERLLDADDIRHFRGALVALGFGLRASGDRLAIEPPVVSPDGAEIQCGNAGTLYRFLTATLTVVPGRWVLDGSPRLRERPIRPLVDALRSLGARIRYRGGDGQAPLEIEGGSLRGGETSLDAAESSQYASALIMAGTCAPAPVRVRLEALSSSPYLELTVEALRDFGVEVGRDASRTHYHVEPGRLRAPRHLVIEGDYSAATYPAVAALVTGGRVRLAGLRAESAQGDRAFFDLLVAAGARVEARDDGIEVERAGKLRAIRADLRDMPDQVPTLAALAPFLEGTTEITGVRHLRVKESDRLAAMASELGRAGVPVRELDDGLIVEGCWFDREPPVDPVVIDPHDDHRIAMALALVGLRRPGLAIADPEVVGKSYPNFWRDLTTLLS